MEDIRRDIDGGDVQLDLTKDDLPSFVTDTYRWLEEQGKAQKASISDIKVEEEKIPTESGESTESRETAWRMKAKVKAIVPFPVNVSAKLVTKGGELIALDISAGVATGAAQGLLGEEKLGQVLREVLIDSLGEGYEGTDITFELTEEGRLSALRIIRVHRLWERNFADETGLAETQWHVEAKRREHVTSPEQAEALAMQMGNPFHDPHGDPIPTCSYQVSTTTCLPALRSKYCCSIHA